MKLVTAAQMRALEEGAVRAGVALDELMRQAGLAVAQEAWLTLGSIAGRRVLVLAGPGNHGGDGLVAARHFAEWEADVTVYIAAGRPAHDAMMDEARQAGALVRSAADDVAFASLDEALVEAECIVDALLGIGRTRAIEGAMAEALRRTAFALQRPRPPVVIAVDVPSGVDADSGSADPLALPAVTTVTFGFAKPGLYLQPGAALAGRVQVIDIGLPPQGDDAHSLELLDGPSVRNRVPGRDAAGNKGTFGRVLVVGGAAEYAGAPRLSAEAAYRAGAGLVTVACTERVQSLIAPALPEATWLPLPAVDGHLAPEAASRILDHLDAYDVLLIGPGLGQSADVREIVLALLAHGGSRLRAAVIDADALNVLRTAPSGAYDPAWSEHIHLPAVLTPHPGEMARLRDASVESVQSDRIGVAAASAGAWHQVVVLKGANTVIAAPDGRVALSPHANPLLATAGSGDVLAGIVAGFLAQGADRFDAAACAVYLHGLAAEELAPDLGDRGMLASDLLPSIPRALQVLRHGRRSSPLTSPFGDLASAFASPAPPLEP
ncbi:MAG: NAD(P)H-hydrate dehydratase [Chloroflexi bacterium]|nr:NAD(P)H-hydrate dehydratase [Chloroflexota bacterium]